MGADVDGAALTCKPTGVNTVSRRLTALTGTVFVVRTVVVGALVASTGLVELRAVVGASWPLPRWALATSVRATATGISTVRRALMG